MEKFFGGFMHFINDIREYPPVTLAYIGDAVYELFVRSYLLSGANITSYELHKEAINFVSAKNQAGILNLLMEELNDDEKNIVRRARNQKTVSLPKNAHPEDYKLATAFEALIGYLYLKKEYARMQKILEFAIEKQKG